MEMMDAEAEAQIQSMQVQMKEDREESQAMMEEIAEKVGGNIAENNYVGAENACTGAPKSRARGRHSEKLGR